VWLTLKAKCSVPPCDPVILTRKTPSEEGSKYAW
jgi:hypothetical protein